MPNETDTLTDLSDLSDLQEAEPDPGLPAVVAVDGWAGRREHPCRVVGETPKRYRIAVDQPTQLPRGLLLPGVIALVPRAAVRFVSPGEARP